MDREILFRAWHKDSKVMFEVLAIAFYMKKVGVKWHGAERDIAINQFEIMQFTGLHDKNGTAIFEGDVVRSNNKAYEDVPSINSVSFVNGCFKLVAPRINDIPLFNYQSKDIEVIGDIFSNPELLTQ